MPRARRCDERSRAGVDGPVMCVVVRCSRCRHAIYVREWVKWASRTPGMAEAIEKHYARDPKCKAFHTTTTDDVPVFNLGPVHDPDPVQAGPRRPSVHSDRRVHARRKRTAP